MQVVREFRITVGSLKEKKGGRGEGWTMNGQGTNMAVKTMNTNKLLGWGESAALTPLEMQKVVLMTQLEIQRRNRATTEGSRALHATGRPPF
jgi:hypothetical protein